MGKWRHCKKCDGAGVVDVGPDEWEDCPSCDGEGGYDPDEDYNDQRYDAWKEEQIAEEYE